MNKKNILMKLQEKYKEGGYALVSPKTGKVMAFSETLQSLYTIIDQKQIHDADKMVMYVPPPNLKHVFYISLSIRIHQ